MKKFITTLMITFFSVSLFAQNISDTSGVTFNRVYSDMKEGVKAIGAALKQPIEHVYNILIFQAKAESISNVIIYMIIFTGLLLVYRKFILGFRKLQNEEHHWFNDDIFDHTSIWLPMIIMFVLLICFSSYFFSTISDTITGFINPEFIAIEKIFEFINPPQRVYQ